MASGHELTSIAQVLQQHLETRVLGSYPRLLACPRMERPLRLAQACGAVVRRGGWVPFYSTTTDEITLPSADWYRSLLVFKSPARLATDCCHELIHWASGPKRLNRLHVKERGDAACCRAELEAELGAVILCRELQVTHLTILPHARYLHGYLRGLAHPDVELAAAMTAAARACGYLLQMAKSKVT